MSLLPVPCCRRSGSLSGSGGTGGPFDDDDVVVLAFVAGCSGRQCHTTLVGAEPPESFTVAGPVVAEGCHPRVHGFGGGVDVVEADDVSELVEHEGAHLGSVTDSCVEQRPPAHDFERYAVSEREGATGDACSTVELGGSGFGS